MGEVIDRAVLGERLEKARAAGKKIVFTNGCFDILHRGHVECLRQAKGLGDVLVVGLNSDESVRRLKGEGRPYQDVEDRAAVLSSLAFVDFVCVFAEDTPLSLIRELRPHVLVKGGDYKRSDVVGADDVESWGGEVLIVDLVPAPSTTATLKRVNASRRPK